MLPRIKELRKFEEIRKGKKLHDGPAIHYNECKQAIVLQDGVYYCGVWKEKISDVLCRYCPYYDRETLEYKLFRRE